MNALKTFASITLAAVLTAVFIIPLLPVLALGTVVSLIRNAFMSGYERGPDMLGDTIEALASVRQ